jgi:hypothetical protein
MRLVLIASFSSLDAEDFAIRLRACGYDTVTYYELHKRDYDLNHGRPMHTLEAHKNIIYELITRNAAIAVHPSTDPAFVQELAALCRFVGRRLLPALELPMLAPSRCDRHWQDRVRCLAGPNPHDAERVMHVLDNEPQMNVEGYVPGTTKQLAPAMAAPAPATLRLRKRLVALIRRCNGALRAADAFIGDGLKNPMTRQKLAQARSDALPVPREYRVTETLSTTG